MKMAIADNVFSETKKGNEKPFSLFSEHEQW